MPIKAQAGDELQSAAIYANNEFLGEMEISGNNATYMWNEVPKGDYALSVQGISKNGWRVLSDSLSVSAKEYGLEMVMSEDFDNASFSRLGESFSISDNLNYSNYNYGIIESKDNMLHMSRTPEDSESFSTKESMISYSGEAVDSALPNSLGRSGYWAYEVDIIPSQTNVSFYPLRTAYNTSASSRLNFLKFTNKGTVELGGTQISTYAANEKYHIRIEVDIINSFVDCYINDVRVAAHGAMAIDDGYRTSAISSIGTAISAEPGKNAEFYVDNIKLWQYIRPASQEVVIVSPDGENKTISAGIAATRSRGATVLVKSGEYAENIYIDKMSGNENDKLKIIGEEGAVIKGTLSINRYCSNISIENLTFDGETKYIFTDEEKELIASKTMTDQQKAEFVQRSNDVNKDAITLNAVKCDVRGCKISNYAGLAISVLASDAYIGGNYIYNVGGGVVTASRSLVENNEVERINLLGASCGIGDVFRLFGDDVIIRNNYSHGTIESELYAPLAYAYAHADFVQSFDNTRIHSGNGIVENNIGLGFYHQCFMLENDSYGSGGEFCIHDLTIRNNIFAGFGSWGVCGGKENGGIPGMEIYNNFFDGTNAYYGISMNGLNSDAIVYNNVIINRVPIRTTSGGVILSKNNVLIVNDATNKNFLTGLASIDDDGSSIVYTNLADAGFVNYTAGYKGTKDGFDLHLKADSPLRDGGTDVEFSYDLEGNSRKIGNATDIGPYEQ